jgi:hypothetical protein
VRAAGTSLGYVDPSKPTEPHADPYTSIPRSRQGDEEPLVGEVIPKGVPLGRPAVYAEQENAPGAAPPPSGPPVAPPKKRGRLRTAFIVVAALAVALCLGGLAAGYLIYDKATKPDTTTPTGSLDQYLEAKFVSRDPLKIENFVCASPSLDEMNAMLDKIEALEKKFNIHIDVERSGYQVDTVNNKSTIKATLKVLVPEEQGQVSESHESWTFSLVNQNGWRVCGAHQER